MNTRLRLFIMIELNENSLCVDTYLKIREKVEWKKLTVEQAEKALMNSLFTVVAMEDKEVLGMGRIVGDGAVVCYIQDLVIVPEAQGKGIGKMIMDRMISFVETIQLDGTEMMLDLMCAKGREEFYHNLGFISRPTESLGPGMIRYMNKTSKCT